RACRPWPITRKAGTTDGGRPCLTRFIFVRWRNMPQNNSRLRQIMDWRAAVIAGLLAGGLTMLLWMVLLTMTTGGTIWAPFHHVAAILLGEGALTPSQAINTQVVLTGTVIHLFLAVLYALVLAFTIHR